MGEITQNAGQAPGKGKVRVKKLSTKVDMTPMVDLAFLLLTFFILTATFSKSHVLDLDMPERVSPGQPVNVRNVLNLVLAENNKIYWWIGLDPPVHETNYSNNGVRKLLLEKYHANPSLMVLIKPKDNSKYQNIIDILDEMRITRMERFSVMNFTESDEQIIAGDVTH